MKRTSVSRIIFALVLLGIASISLFRTIAPLWNGYTTPYFTDNVYGGFEAAYNGSQYRMKENAGLIPDETVFSYASGAYIRGVDPILINSEHTPLGKYIIGLFILMLKNDKFVVIPSAIFTLILMWTIGRIVLKDGVLALVPVVFLATEPLFLNQIRTAPLLDIIQLPWILFAIAGFLWEKPSRKFILTAVMVGFVMATKTIVPAILLVSTFVIFLFLQRQRKQIVRLLLWLSLSVVIFIASYTRTFMSGYSIGDFIGFQKWIFLYQQSKLIFPFSAWRLLFFNQWQAWWGDMRILTADDWHWTWPVSSALGIYAVVLLVTRKLPIKEPITLLVLWFSVYSIFLSLGVVSSRFFLPLFPLSFIVSVWVIRKTVQSIWH